MIYFFDENISEYAARMLSLFDRKNTMRPSIDHFPKGTPDLEWIPAVASWDSTVTAICGDPRILRNKAERKILRDCGLMFVYLAPGWTNLAWNELAWKIVKVWPYIAKAVEQSAYPMVFEVTVGMKVQAVRKTRDL